MMQKISRNLFVFFILMLAVCVSVVHAANRTVNLTVDYKTVNFAGKHIKTIAINNQIPGPTLHFREGDHVTIHVFNRIHQGTALHWHGILLPWQMDGVAHVTQAPIPQGGVFHYHFTLKQSGTYWYHAHSDLQEQQGLYGALLIEPRTPEPYHYTRDVVIFLSDWINTPPDQVYRNLKASGDYYSPKFPIQPSLARYLAEKQKARTPAEQHRVNMTWQMMQTMRMSPFDFSDIAYDALLMNGHPATSPFTTQVKIGDIVRLRLIDGGGSTQFRVKIPGQSMQLVHVQGNDIVPRTVDSLTLSPGETYDVLVKITRATPTIVYAASTDGLGKVYGALVTRTHQPVNFANIKPFPEPQAVMMMPATHQSTTHTVPRHMTTTDDMNMDMDMDMDMDMGHSMSSTHMQQTSATASAENNLAAGTKYAELRSPHITNNPDKPYTIIHMSLSGWMGRYDWFLNGKPEYLATPILIEPGKRYRFIFSNETMMHHPMHLHGHWLILRNGHGKHDPRLHTIDVPPSGTLTADFDADANSGFWYFHCHNLFHMKSGMSNLVKYHKTPLPEFYTHMHAHNEKYTAHPALWYLANTLEAGGNPEENIYQITFNSLFGADFNKLQLHVEDAEIKSGDVQNADLDIFYWHLIDQFWALKGGANYYYRPATRPYWQPGIGLEGQMPYFIDTNLRLYSHAGSTKLDIILGRDTQLLDNFLVHAEIRGIFASATTAADLVGSGVNQWQFSLMPYYRLAPGLNLFAKYEYQRYVGVTQNLLKNKGESATDNSLTAGVTVLF